MLLFVGARPRLRGAASTRETKAGRPFSALSLLPTVKQAVARAPNDADNVAAVGGATSRKFGSVR
jgi:hypothetical protein